MQSPSSEGAAREAAWQWDGEADDGAEAAGEVIGGGGGRPRLSRRGVLAGAGLLAAGGAVWAFGRSSTDQADGAKPKPQPTALSGPTPLWTYRAPEAMTPERLANQPGRPLFLSPAGLQVLDPATGSAGRLLAFDPPSRDWPSDAALQPKVVLGPDHLFTSTSPGHLDARHFTDPAADWSLPLPEELEGDVRLAGCDGTLLYGSVWGRSVEEVTQQRNRLFAVRLSDRSIAWTVRPDHLEQPLTPVTAAGGRLPLARNLGNRSELVVRSDTDGTERWTAPGEEDLRWCTTGTENTYLPDGRGGVRALGPGGLPRWTVSPGPSEQWRAMPPVPDGPRVYVPRDNGLLTGHDAPSGKQTWTCRLPFLLDRRSHPLVVGGTLYVPGPAAGGVCAVDTATGRLLWTFRDSGPGKDVWILAADADRLYAGRDDIVHALALR
ncbi:PQQ-binding-like beta-propeller repeat protein [Kitasatospora sp. NPDC097643]|uniref:outer membrane protein assembly factor BamB family protein n=1 Tax=Kitasatospora sp. NPDC097643 TaxID=3157230 RepID=UPI0033168F48